MMITRCPSCRATFKVVADQLRLGEGWVKCGKCFNVFNAQEHIFQVPVYATPNVTLAAAAPDPVEHAIAPSPAPDSPVQQITLSVRDDDFESAAQLAPDLTAQPAVAAPLAPYQASPAGNESGEGAAFHPPPYTPAFPTQAPNPNRFSTAEGYAASAQSNAESAAQADEEGAKAEPDFVLKSKRQERWQSWPVRLALSVLLTISTATALAQAAYLNRQALLGAYPQSASMLSRLCTLIKSSPLSLPCELQPLKSIEAMQVDSHTLAIDSSNSSTDSGYILTLTLKNKLEVANSWPALDISFTDTTGAVQARRILEPKDYLGAAAEKLTPQGIKPLDEQRLTVRFDAPTVRINGYEIAVFYP